MWIVVFALLPCVCALQCFKLFKITLLFVLKFVLYPCLFCSLPYTLVFLQFALQPCLCLEKSTSLKMSPPNICQWIWNKYHCVSPLRVRLNALHRFSRTRFVEEISTKYWRKSALYLKPIILLSINCQLVKTIGCIEYKHKLYIGSNVSTK